MNRPLPMVFVVFAVAIALARPVAAVEDLPTGWLPVAKLTSEQNWEAFREDKDRVHLYLPNGDAPVRGVFACIVFHSGDPREVADAWDFALVTVPTTRLNDMGIRSRETGRRTLGYQDRGTGLLLDYLTQAAAETGHRELASVPIVGWFGQAGGHYCSDLYGRAPDRVLAWADSFTGELRRYPELTQKVPFAFAWEVRKGDVLARKRTPHRNNPPVADLGCQASVYGFPHGIYSKYNFFMGYLDRCIKLRLPEQMPPPGQPVKLKPVVRSEGWVGDFLPISEWNPIARADSEAGQQMEHPVWMPDAYAAAMWRAYHSADPDIRLTEPVVPYHSVNRSAKMGLGYGGHLIAETRVAFAADTKGEYIRVEFYDGDVLLGQATEAPWQIDNVTLPPGLHALYAVGVELDGARTASRPAFVTVKPLQ